MNADPQQAKAIFLQAVEKHDPEQWPAFLDQACAGQPDLRRRVGLLLQAHREAGTAAQQAADESPPPRDKGGAVEQPGVLIGPYKLLEQIGEGGMGTVWMAQQTEPVKRAVALKLIKAGMDSKQVIARFETERQALALMDHPNIAKVLDAGTTPKLQISDFRLQIENKAAASSNPQSEICNLQFTGRPYFVMELVKGAPITKYCDEHHLTPRQRLELFIPVCQAVQHAHQKGIIHRDLKPSNVLVALYDGKPVPKVIDFGVAKAAGQPFTEKTLVTGFGNIVGTLEYMSPEQAEINQLDIDTRSDIYSLGVLLYELLTGTTPLERKRVKESGLLEALRIIREEEVPTLSNRLSTTAELPAVAAKRGLEPAKLTKLVRGELDWIVMKALEKGRNRRYESGSAFAADVQRYLKDEPVEACPPSAWYRFRTFARRNKRGLLTAAVVALAVLLTAAGSGMLIWRAFDRERRGAYFQRIALAEREWASNNLSRMEELLRQCPEDLRGWEWHYLKRLRHGALPTLRHESPVYSVAFSPDGQYLATATKDGLVRLWKAKTGQELRKWQAHEDNAPSVQFSPDSRSLASGGWDAKVKVWDVQKVLQGEVQAPRFQLEHNTRVRVWSVTFSPDGQRLASAGGRTADEKGEVKVWDLKTRQESLTMSGFTDSVRCAVFSPDGRRLATCSQDMVQVWDAQTGRKQLTWRDYLGNFRGVAFSPDGRRLAAAGGHLGVYPDREVKVWDSHTGQEILSLRGHIGGLQRVAFSPDGRRLASTGVDQTVKLWDAATGQEVLTLRGHLDNVYCLAFSADGHQLASGSVDNTVRIWDTSLPERTPEHLTLRGHTGAVTDVAFHPTDGRSLVSAGTDGTVRVWDAWSGKDLGTLHGPPSTWRGRVAYSPDGRRLAAASAGPGLPVRVWEVETEKEICNFSGEMVMCVAFSPDGRHVASAGYDNDFTVRVWDATTAQVVRPLKGHTWPIFGVAFSPDGRHLASGGGDSTVRIWDWTTGEERPALRPQHAGRVANVAFSRNGKLLASASWDRTIKLWDTATWRLLHDLPHPSGVQCVAFDRDGPRLACGSTDGTVMVWDGPGMEFHVLRGHTSWVQGVAFSHDGKWIASASLDGTVKVWKAPPEPKAPVPETGEPGE